MKLVRQVAKGNDGNKYNNFFLVWRYQNNLYAVRVRPCFGKDTDKLWMNAETIPEDEPIEKYY